mgnify:FL=1
METKNLALFYDGQDFYLGSFDERLKSFVTLSGQTATIHEEIINKDFTLDTPNLMVLKDAIEKNVYGEDRNLGLENGGLDENENRFINAVYALREIKKIELLKYQYLLNKKIKTRMVNCSVMNEFREASKELETKVENLYQIGEDE